MAHELSTRLCNDICNLLIAIPYRFSSFLVHFLLPSEEAMGA